MSGGIPPSRTPSFSNLMQNKIRAHPKQDALCSFLYHLQFAEKYAILYFAKKNRIILRGISAKNDTQVLVCSLSEPNGSNMKKGGFRERRLPPEK